MKCPRCGSIFARIEDDGHGSKWLHCNMCGYDKLMGNDKSLPIIKEDEKHDTDES